MDDSSALTRLLARAGFIAADDEAAELLAAAGGDPSRLDVMVQRRLTGEPLAWITGTVTFCGLEVRVRPGVYVPRWQTEALALRAGQQLPDRGTAVDLCTGSGAVAKHLRAVHPGARVVATDIDPCAVACARDNGVDTVLGDLFTPLPADLMGAVDVVVGVVPYVPTAELPLLQRDTFTFEGTRSYDGGSDGTDTLRRVIAGAVSLLRADGALLLELGGTQADQLRQDLDHAGYIDVLTIVDADGDVRGVEATRGRLRA